MYYIYMLCIYNIVYIYYTRNNVMLFLTSFVSCASITVVVSVLLCVVVNVLLSCIMTKTQHGDGKKKEEQGELGVEEKYFCTVV